MSLVIIAFGSLLFCKLFCLVSLQECCGGNCKSHCIFRVDLKATQRKWAPDESVKCNIDSVIGLCLGIYMGISPYVLM